MAYDNIAKHPQINVLVSAIEEQLKKVKKDSRRGRAESKIPKRINAWN